MRSALYRLVNGRPQITGEGGTRRAMTAKEMLGKGWKLLNTFGDDEVMHTAPGVEPPGGATVLKSGRASWQWADLRAENETLADALLHATYEDGEDEDGNPIIGRGFIRNERARGKIPSALESDLPSHGWAGDE